MHCATCKTALTGRHRVFCSKRCLTIANGRKTGGWNKNRIELHCVYCQQPFTVPRSRAQTALTCSRLCHNRRLGDRLRGKPRPERWTSGIQAYRRFKRDACERCGSTSQLLVHHRDGNRYHNVLSNLETLCKRCHQIHHNCEKNLPTLPAS